MGVGIPNGEHEKLLKESYGWSCLGCLGPLADRLPSNFVFVNDFNKQ